MKKMNEQAHNLINPRSPSYHIKYRFAHEAKRPLCVNQREQAGYTNTFRFGKLLVRRDFSNASFSDMIQNILENFQNFITKLLHVSGKLLTFATSFRHTQ